MRQESITKIQDQDSLATIKYSTIFELFGNNYTKYMNDILKIKTS